MNISGWSACFTANCKLQIVNCYSRIRDLASAASQYANRYRASGFQFAICNFQSAILLCAGMLTAAWGQQKPGAWVEAYRDAVGRIIGEALSDTSAWDRLAELTDNFGHRLSGSPQLEQAIRWAVEEMKKDGLENVRAEKVMVPHWVRGNEGAEVVKPAQHKLAMLGLGGSVGTTPDGIEAEILMVKNFEELEANAARVRGKIVVYNVPYAGYGPTVIYRSRGASRAAKHGASAILLRSVGQPGLRTPHTGALAYTENLPKIPAAAISGEDADMLQRMYDRRQTVIVRLKMEARFLPDAESANVIGEIRGREKPEEIVVVGGHFDSWDVGAGATDDGGGCIATWSALRVLKQLNMRPRRTIRVVLFTNEENGLRGGLAYRDQHKDELSNHVLMLESDSGVFRPLGFGFSGNEKAGADIGAIAPLLRGIGASQISAGGGGADIGPAVGAGSVPSMSVVVDGSRYFTVHHTPADTIDKIDPTDLALNVAAIGVMAYVVADMPGRLGQ
jgi:carboxypeptidase Q